MATIRFLLSICLVFILVQSCSLKKGNALHTKKEATEKNYHTVEINSLLPDTDCKPSVTKGSRDRKASLQVFQRHGPCSKHSQGKPNKQPTLLEILSQDQSRVDSIKARLAFSKDKQTNAFRNEKVTTLPAQLGTSLSTSNYIVTIGIGTPSKELSLVFDTGSDITWTQCAPCSGSCYPQQQPIFDPSQSTTYKNITCNSPLCSQIKSSTGISNCTKTTSVCIYGVQYGDKSFSVGYFAQERLTLTPTEVLDNIPFGCGQNNQGLFGKVAGLIGLGRHPLSLVSQTAEKYQKSFSYCLPSSSQSTGHLTFGKAGIPSNVQYTPLANSGDETFYTVKITSISVGGQQLPISPTVLSNAGTIIDSGTVITRLAPFVYRPLRDEFKKQMTKYKAAQPISILDTCYDLSGSTTVQIPTISFSFGNAKVDVVANGILIVVNGPSQVCLAFAEDDSLNIFGNSQQQTHEVVYDIGGSRLGFAPNAC